MNRAKLVAANWKMNGSRAANEAWLAEFAREPAGCEAVVCAPFVYLPQVLAGVAHGVTAGAQDLSQHSPGAYTGETAGEMLVDLGVRWVIVGHSERRAMCGETDGMVAAKARRALDLGLRPIVCVGETLAEREAGQTMPVVQRQIAAVLGACKVAELVGGAIAYEPVWAIGTGRTATPEQAQEVHRGIRTQLARAGSSAAALRILYGGSVKPANAGELFAQPDIDGGLIGGASLNARDFRAICAAAR
jgi:triosephosphate isomerase